MSIRSFLSFLSKRRRSSLASHPTGLTCSVRSGALAPANWLVSLKCVTINHASESEPICEDWKIRPRSRALREDQCCRGHRLDTCDEEALRGRKEEESLSGR